MSNKQHNKQQIQANTRKQLQAGTTHQHTQTQK